MHKALSIVFLWIMATVFFSCNKEVAETVSKEQAKEEKAESDKTAKKNDLLEKDVEYKYEKAQFKGGYKIYYSSGQRKHNAGDFEGAIADFTKAIEEKPDYGEAYGFRGLSRLKSGDKAGACADWKKAEDLGYPQATQLIQDYCN